MTLIKMVYYLIDKPIDKPVKNIKIIRCYMVTDHISHNKYN